MVFVVDFVAWPIWPKRPVFLHSGQWPQATNYLGSVVVFQRALMLPGAPSLAPQLLQGCGLAYTLLGPRSYQGCGAYDGTTAYGDRGGEIGTGYGCGYAGRVYVGT